MSEPDTNLKAYQRHRFTPHQSPKVEYMPPALNTHQHHPSTPERYGCAYHEGSPTNREAQTRCLVLTDPGQQHQQRVTVDFILTVLTVSVPARARDSWRRLYRQEHGEQLSQLHNAILDYNLCERDARNRAHNSAQCGCLRRTRIRQIKIRQ